MNFLTNEPLVTRAAVVGVVGALLGLAVAFGFDLSADQKTQIMGLATVLAPFIVAAVTRHKVTPMAKMEQDEEQQ